LTKRSKSAERKKKKKRKKKTMNLHRCCLERKRGTRVESDVRGEHVEHDGSKFFFSSPVSTFW